MEPNRLSTPDSIHPTPPSTSSSNATSSPILSLFSRGHTSARSSGSVSSLASSPITRESLDMFGPGKRQLEDVREEPQEPEEVPVSAGGHKDYFLDDLATDSMRMSFDHSPRNSPSADSYYDFADQYIPSTIIDDAPQPKRQKSLERPTSTVSMTGRLIGRISSLKRYKHRSAASPQLSLLTDPDPAPSRSSSNTSFSIVSPTLSAISKHESYLPPSPVRTACDDAFHDTFVEPIAISNVDNEDEEDQGQATTPLLPPIFTELSGRVSPVQSPLQSPKIASAPHLPVSTAAGGTLQSSTLPSPPLSTKPSVSSMQPRSRANTNIVPSAEIPPLQMLDEPDDEWVSKLGHANFSIHPAPYAPAAVDLESYRELRSNWDLARTKYLRHLARTGENYGSTSKVYLHTREKWATIDAEWKYQCELVAMKLAPDLARVSNGSNEMDSSMESSTVLEKPVTHVTIPRLEDSQRFPGLGDEDIVGPMAVGPVRSPTMKATTHVLLDRSSSMKKKNFFRFMSDLLGRNGSERS